MKILLVISFISYWLLVAPVAFAQQNCLKLPTAWQRGIWCGTGTAGTACNNLAGGCTLCDGIKVTQNIIQMLFELAIPVATAMIAWGAFVFMTAGGSDERVKKGRQIMTSAVIGLVVVLGAWIIINTMLHLLTGQANFPWNTVRC
jgi:hypothetical protein